MADQICAWMACILCENYNYLRVITLSNTWLFKDLLMPKYLIVSLLLL